MTTKSIKTCTKCNGKIIMKDEPICMHCGKTYYQPDSQPRRIRKRNRPVDRLRYCGTEERLKDKVVNVWVEHKQARGNQFKSFHPHYVVTCPWCKKDMVHAYKIVRYSTEDKHTKLMSFSCPKNHKITVLESKAEGMIAWR